MEKTLRFREQHQTILQIKKEINKELTEEKLAINAKRVRSLLAQLAGHLNVHLAMEDQALYPRLFKHENKEVQNLARKYSEEMSDLKGKFTEYMKKWPSPLAIEKDPSTFIKETKEIFKALQIRIQKEDNELYYIVDRVS